jgi:hypothetical protein
MRLPVIAACVLAMALPGADQTDPLTLLPVLPRSEPAVVEGSPAAGDGLVTLAPGIRIHPGRMVVLDATVQMDQGPADGLEVIACLRNGKTHETLLRLDTDAAAVVKAAVLAALGLLALTLNNTHLYHFC